MANIKSQIKRNRQNEKRRLRNRNYRGAARTAVNLARSAMEAGVPETKEALMRAISMLDKAAERGVIHPNNAARRKSRLVKHFAALSDAPAQAKVEETKQAMEAPGGEESAPEPTKRTPAKKAAAKKTTAKKTAEKKPAATSSPKGKKPAKK